MSRTRLTKLTVARLDLAPGRDDGVVWCEDLPGFGVRLRRTASGGEIRRTWVAQWRDGTGTSRRKFYGDADTVAPAEARAQARKDLAAAKLGADPQAEKIAKREAIKFGTLAADFLAAVEGAGKLSVSTTNAYRRYLMGHFRELHGRPVRDLTHYDLADELDRLVETSGPIGANRARSALVAMYSWSLRRVRALNLTHNPASLTPIPADESERHRDRILTDDEVRLLWAATADGRDFSRAMRMLLLTGARRMEVGAMRWEELSGDLWTLPRERSKTATANVLPLPPLVLAQLPRRRGDWPYLFGRKMDEPFGGWGNAKAALDARMAKAATGQGLPQPAHWTIHDLRRTFISRLHDLGLAMPHIVKAIVGHREPGVHARHYNRALYLDGKRAALAAWADHVAQLVGEGAANVVPLVRSPAG